MAQRLPIGTPLVAEFRGIQPAGSFTKNGETIARPAKLKFERQIENGDVEMMEVSVSQLDKATPPIDWRSFERGHTYSIVGEGVFQDKGSDRDSFWVATSVTPHDQTLREAA